MFGGLAEVVKRESFIALYKGNGAQMVRVFPYAAIQFTSFEFYKTVMLLLNLFIYFFVTLILCRYFHNCYNDRFYNFQLSGSILGNSSHIGKFVAGSLAGVTAVTFTYPLDTIRARLAFQVTGEHVYNGIIHTAKTIVKNVFL